MIPAVDIKNRATEKAALDILKALSYFDIFDYPLSEKEIKNFLSTPVNDLPFALALERLISDEVIFKFGEFYSIPQDGQKAERRLQGNRRAQKLLPKASAIGAFLYKFPYVRAVGISGSLSKNYADEKADIDFFIITKANRLWISRTILHLFKKLTFLYGKQHFYCMNYFIDEEAFTIPERNIYIATEIATLLPVAGSEVMSKFFEANSWIKKWLPVYRPDRNLSPSEKGSAIKRFVEWLFNKGMGVWLDHIFFTWSTRRWQKKEKQGLRNSKGKIMNLITDKHFSKSNPEAFQERIVTAYENRIAGIKARWPQYFD